MRASARSNTRVGVQERVEFGTGVFLSLVSVMCGYRSGPERRPLLLANRHRLFSLKGITTILITCTQAFIPISRGISQQLAIFPIWNRANSYY